MKLLFFGRLCRAKSDCFHKLLFNLRIGQVLTADYSKKSITLDFIKILAKYDLTPFIEEFLTSCYSRPSYSGRKL